MNTPDEQSSGNAPSGDTAGGGIAVADPSADGAVARLGVFRASVVEERQLEASRARMLADEYHRLRADLRGRLGREQAVTQHEESRGKRRSADYLGLTSGMGLEVEAMVTEYALACQLAHGVISRLLDAGLAVADGVWVGDTRVRLDDVREAWEQGLVQARHVTVIISELRRVNDPARAVTLRDELLAEAPGVTPGQLEATARRLRTQLDADTLAQAHRRAFQNRHIALTQADDGMAVVTLLTDAVTAVAIVNRTRAIAKRIQHDQNIHAASHTGQGDAESNPVPVDTRTLGQVQHDVAAELLIGGVTVDDQLHHTTGSTVSKHVQATVTVTVPAMTLLGHDETPAELDGYGPIAAEAARVLVENSVAAEDHQAWYRILTDPATGIPLRYDRQTYSPPPSLRRYVQQRDGTCRFPGCRRPSRHCDIDHTIDWQFDGHTDANNLACLCRRHHTMKHHTDWTVEHLGTDTSGGTLRWTSPTGATYITRPQPHTPATLAKNLNENTGDSATDDTDKPPF